MQDGIIRGIPYHPWPYPAHHFTYLFTLFRRMKKSQSMMIMPWDL